MARSRKPNNRGKHGLDLGGSSECSQGDSWGGCGWRLTARPRALRPKTPQDPFSGGAPIVWTFLTINGLLVTTIGTQAFSYCIILTSGTIPNSGTSSGYAAFSFCTSLTCVTIPNSITNIDNYAFYYCTSLSNATIPSNIGSIGDGTFEFCSGLTSVTIPSSVTSVGRWAFLACPSLTRVYFTGNAPWADSSAFVGDSATVYYLPGALGWKPQVQPGSSGVSSNQFGFTISGTNGLGTAVLACTNLAMPDWRAVATNSLVGGVSYFSDPQWTNYPARFYRLANTTYAGLPVQLLAAPTNYPYGYSTCAP